MKIWSCKIGESAATPNQADGPMREAVAEAYERMTGEAPTFIFSGWGAALTEPERAVVENRLPEPQTAEQAYQRLVDAVNGLAAAPDHPATAGDAEDAARLEWVLRHTPGDALRYSVGVLADTADLSEFRAAIDAAIRTKKR